MPRSWATRTAPTIFSSKVGTRALNAGAKWMGARYLVPNWPVRVLDSAGYGTTRRAGYPACLLHSCPDHTPRVGTGDDLADARLVKTLVAVVALQDFHVGPEGA